MESSYLGIVFSSIWIVNCFCSTDFRNISETQPTFVGQLHEPKIVWLYPENHNLQIESHKADNQAYYTNPSPSVTFAGVERSIQVAEPMKFDSPQILYDFRRPHVQASNLGKRVLQPPNAGPGSAPNHNKKSYKNVPSILSSETIVSPLQTNNALHQNIQHPLYNIQPQYYIPKKYALVNGKFVYDPKSLQLVQRPTLPTFYHSSQQFPQFQQPLVHQFQQPLVQQFQQPLVHQFQQPLAHQPKILPRPVPITGLPHINRGQFKAPSKSQLQPIDTPSELPVQAEQKESEDEEEPTREEEPVREEEAISEGEPIGEEPTREEKPVLEDKAEEENEDNANYEDDDEPERYESSEFEKYFHDDEDDHEHVENDDNDDSDRGSTSFVPSKKFPKKYNFKPAEKGEIVYGRRNEHPEKALQKPKKKQKMHYKSYRYSKDSAEYPEVIEGRQSEQVPVTHKQNILKEKWYLTKSLDNEQFD